jgi:glycosyltransferase involved in cell wall biosynthesis
MPVFVLEAMAHGLPVVVSDVGALRRVSDGAGRCVDVEDVEQLSGAMLAYLEDPSLADADGARGRVRTENEHSISAVSRHLADSYAELLR